MSKQSEIDKIEPTFLAWLMLRIGDGKSVDIHDDEVREDLIKYFIDEGIGTKDRFELVFRDGTKDDDLSATIEAINYKE